MGGPVVMKGVREYGEGCEWDDTERFFDCVELAQNAETRNRLAIIAYNEAGYNCTMVDLLDLLGWVKANRPEIWEQAANGGTEEE